MANLSYHPKFIKGALVWYNGEVCSIGQGARYDTDGANGVPFVPEFMLYEVIHDGGQSISDVPEPELRALEWKEFRWYRDPGTGRMKIGKNRAWAIIAAETVGGIVAGTSLGYFLAGGDSWNLAGVLVGLLPWVATRAGTRENYKRYLRTEVH